MENDYDQMTKDELIKVCQQKDSAINEYITKIQNDDCIIYGKNDIMNMYSCESNKALKILKLLFQMGKGNKIGKEYYVTKQNHNDFIRSFQGKEVAI